MSTSASKSSTQKNIPIVTSVNSDIIYAEADELVNNDAIPVIEAQHSGQSNCHILHTEDNPLTSASFLDSTKDQERQKANEHKQNIKAAHDTEEPYQISQLASLKYKVSALEKSFAKMIIKFSNYLKSQDLTNVFKEKDSLSLCDYVGSLAKTYSIHSEVSLVSEVFKNKEITHVDKILFVLSNKFSLFSQYLDGYQGEYKQEIEVLQSISKEYYISYKPTMSSFAIADSFITAISDSEQALTLYEIYKLELSYKNLQTKFDGIKHALGTLFIQAVRESSITKASFYNNLGADYNFSDRQGKKALEIAWNNPEMLKFVAKLDSAFSMTPFSNGKLPLNKAVEECDDIKLEILLEKGVQNKESFTNPSSLHLAAKYSFKTGIDKLLESGANPDSMYIDTSKMTYLQWAYMYMSVTFKYLFGYKPEGETALHIVTEKAIEKAREHQAIDKELTMMKFLVQGGAKSDINNYYGESVQEIIFKECAAADTSTNDFCYNTKALLGMEILNEASSFE